MITTRDLKIINFVEEYKIASTSTLSEVFFNSNSACYKRLQVLYGDNKLKRYRDSINNEYLYFVKQPKQLKHSLLVSSFYRELHKKCEIVNFKIEPVMGDIRPDAVFGYRYNGKNYLGLLEVEISHKGFNYRKYDKFYSSGDYKNYLPVMPTVFVVGDNINVGDSRNVKYVIIGTDFGNFNIDCIR